MYIAQILGSFLDYLKNGPFQVKSAVVIFGTLFKLNWATFYLRSGHTSCEQRSSASSTSSGHKSGFILENSDVLSKRMMLNKWRKTILWVLEGLRFGS